MKTIELLEQHQRKKSAEEKEALRNAPDFWRKELRKEFNEIVKKHGGTTRGFFDKYDNNVAHLGGIITISIDGPSTMMSRNKRAKSFEISIAKWIHSQLSKYEKIELQGVMYKALALHLAKDFTQEKVLQYVRDTLRLEHRFKWMGIRSNPEKIPLKMDFTVVIYK